MCSFYALDCIHLEINVDVLCHLHTEGVAICDAQIATYLVYIEKYISIGSKTAHHVSCAPFWVDCSGPPHIDKQCSNVYAKATLLDTYRQCLQCAWALMWEGSRILQMSLITISVLSCSPGFC